MDEEVILKKLEEQIENLEGMKYTFNVRLDDAIERAKSLRFAIKYGTKE